MNKEIRDKWIAALKSGDYAQGKDYMYSKARNTYCCLGVLRELVEPGARYRFENTSTLDRRHSAGLEESTCKFLANMNDEGRSFLEIADYIEQNIPVDEPVLV